MRKHAHTYTPRVYPRITDDQLEAIQVEVAKICDTLNRAPSFAISIERNLANRLGVRTLKHIRQPMYAAALQMARDALDFTESDLPLHQWVAHPIALSDYQPVAAGQH